jgi:DNA polymerase-3 subunit gamma/tau
VVAAPAAVAPAVEAPAAVHDEEDAMMAEAAEPSESGPRRDPEEVALELLQTELGARKIEG